MPGSVLWYVNISKATLCDNLNFIGYQGKLDECYVAKQACITIFHDQRRHGVDAKERSNTGSMT